MVNIILYYSVIIHDIAVLYAPNGLDVRCVADYIRELADGKDAGHPAAFARVRFNALPEVQREWLAERVAEVVLALHEGNIIAWGVDRETWQRYATRVQR